MSLGNLPNPEVLEWAWRNQENLVYWDWDDTLLVAAYDKAQRKSAEEAAAKSAEEAAAKSAEGAAGKSGEEAASNNVEKGAEGKMSADLGVKQWPVGSYCRALYSVDGWYYEAKVLSVTGNRCMVEYLGYKNKEEVEVQKLKPSKGKKERKDQVKIAKEDMKYSEHAAAGQENNYGPSSERSYDYSSNQGDFAVHHQPRHYCPHSEFPQNLPFMTVPPVPPMPPCSVMSNDKSLSAMLMSWYMAGYYTGLNQKQKGAAQCHHGHSHY